MTTLALNDRPRHRLFAAAFEPRHPREPMAWSSEKRQTVRHAKSAEAVMASSNASRLGYHSNNRQRET